jgi:hypothetical protein
MGRLESAVEKGPLNFRNRALASVQAAFGIPNFPQIPQ